MQIEVFARRHNEQIIKIINLQTQVQTLKDQLDAQKLNPLYKQRSNSSRKGKNNLLEDCELFTQDSKKNDGEPDFTKKKGRSYSMLSQGAKPK